jgi:hypothetical protein
MAQRRDALGRFVAKGQRPRDAKGRFVKIEDRDHGYSKLLRGAAKASRGATLDLGVLGEAGSEQRGDVQLAELALIHELGLGNVPERSWLREWFDANLSPNRKAIRNAMAKVARGKLTTDQALELLGLRWAGEIKQRISSGIAPPNAPETVEKKGSSVPLIDKGQFRQSITHRAEAGRR